MKAILLVALVAMMWSLSLAGTRCSNPIPGVGKLFHGVDITELDLVPLEVTGHNGFKYPILDFTCDQGREKVDKSGTRYQIPDQVWHTSTVPAGWLSSDVNLYKSYNDVRDSNNINVGLEGAYKKFSFSSSASYKYMQNTITNESRYISDVVAVESATKVMMNPALVLQMDKFAKMLIDKTLTGSYSSNAKAYRDIIDKFGTHFFSVGNFGGYLRVIHETDMSYFYSKSDREVKLSAQASFMNILSVKAGVSSSSTKVDEKFLEKSTIKVKYYGGNTNLLAENGINEWQPTVDSDPWLYSGELEPITELIQDPSIKSSMEEAVAQYTMEKYLQELRRLVNFAKTKVGVSFVSSLEKRIIAMQSRNTLVDSDVKALGTEVERELVVPDWFHTRTQLCYQWRPDHPGGQCGGGVDRLLCARPNSMTTYYKDDTDGRGGGCRMQWGIKSEGHQAWFSKVKVCYWWYPDADGSQCQGGKRELCAGVNSFTSEYGDDTDNRAGGCHMSWRLVFPYDAPVWMKTAKLCFNWFPDGDGGQCGGRAPRNICARAGEWTRHYFDDTDNRRGGCRMSWGITMSL